MAKESEKRIAINKIFEELHKKSPQSNVLRFDNNKVKEVTGVQFRNQFDATKYDSYKSLPHLLKKHGFFIIHLGQGEHAFVKGEGFHKFEEVTDIVDWDKFTENYMDKISKSEAQSASTAFNDQIIHDFLFDDINKDVLIHTARRAKTHYSFKIGYEKLDTGILQIEMDAVYECGDTIVPVEVKNIEHDDFEIRQLFSSMKYFEMWKEKGIIPQNMKIRLLFMIRVRKKEKNYYKMYEYRFKDKNDPNSIELIKCKKYKIKR